MRAIPIQLRLLLLLCLFFPGLARSQDATNESATPRILVIGKDGLATDSEGTNSVALQGLPLITNLQYELPEESSQSMPVTPVVNLEPVVQAMQLMIEQQRLALQAMEQSRANAEEEAARTSQVMQEKLESMQTSFETQRAQDLASMEKLNRVVLGIAISFAGVGFLVMLLTAWFFMRTMKTVSELTHSLQQQVLTLAEGNSSYPALGPATAAKNFSSETASQRLIGAMEDLEKRIKDLEVSSPVKDSENAPSARKSPEPFTPKPDDNWDAGHQYGGAAKEDSGESTAASLSAKGQTYLNLDESEEALRCFSQALEKEPENAELYLKKGTALERLRRMEEALEAYNRAIRFDGTLTMAYLAKGGVCNRLERYSEALECYEKALQSQQNSAAV